MPRPRRSPFLALGPSKKESLVACKPSRYQDRRLGFERTYYAVPQESHAGHYINNKTFYFQRLGHTYVRTFFMIATQVDPYCDPKAAPAFGLKYQGKPLIYDFQTPNDRGFPTNTRPDLSP